MVLTHLVWDWALVANSWAIVLTFKKQHMHQTIGRLVKVLTWFFRTISRWPLLSGQDWSFLESGHPGPNQGKQLKTRPLSPRAWAESRGWCGKQRGVNDREEWGGYRGGWMPFPQVFFCDPQPTYVRRINKLKADNLNTWHGNDICTLGKKKVRKNALIILSRL